MYFIYNILLIITYILFLPYFLLQLIRHPYEWKQRLGIFSFPDFANERNERKLIWLHAASVGEVNALIPIIRELSKRFPKANLILSTITITGHKQAQSIRELSYCFILPFDTFWFTASLIKSLRPNILIIAETELWPNLLRNLYNHNIPMVLVNGRLSAKSFKRYNYLYNFFSNLLEKFAFISVQSELDRDRFKGLGALSERLYVLGSTKYDTLPGALDEIEKNKIRQQWHLADNPIITFGSVRPDEEEDILAVIRELQEQYKYIIFIIAPRHLQRIEEIVKIGKNKGLQFTLRTEKIKLELDNIFLLDTIGELVKAYAISEIAFVGGSLADYGGHNPLEPAALGVPVVFGNYMQNCQDVADELIRYNAAKQVNNPKELLEIIIKLHTNTDLHNSMRKATLDCVEQNRGISERTVDLIETIVKSKE